MAIFKMSDSSNLSEKFQSADRHKHVESNVHLLKMRSDALNSRMLKHRKWHNLDEVELRDEIKGGKK